MNPWAGLSSTHRATVGPCRKSPRFDVAARLLEHGGLTLTQLLEITGWKKYEAAYVLFYMSKDGVVEKLGRRGRYVYRLAE